MHVSSQLVLSKISALVPFLGLVILLTALRLFICKMSVLAISIHLKINYLDCIWPSLQWQMFFIVLLWRGGENIF